MPFCPKYPFSTIFRFAQIGQNGILGKTAFGQNGKQGKTDAAAKAMKMEIFLQKLMTTIISGSKAKVKSLNLIF